MTNTENPGAASQIADDIGQAENALRDAVNSGLADCSQRIAYAQASAMLALARLLYRNTQFD